MSSSSLSLKMNNVLVECVMECSKMYSFDGLDALMRLGLVVEGSREFLAPHPLLEKVEEKSQVEGSVKAIGILAPLPLLEKVEEKSQVEGSVKAIGILAPPFPKVEKGRPKKEKKALEVQGVDLFAELIAESIGEVDEKVMPAVEKKEKKSISAEKKESVKAAKEAKKEAIKAEKEAKKEQAKAAKLATTKEAKKKETKAATKKSAKNSTENLVENLAENLVENLAENLAPPFPKVEESDIVKKFEYEGSNYLKSKKSGIIYNLEQEVVGKWNEETQKIDFEEEDDDSSDEE